MRFSDVVTGDECWISFFTMKDKRSNMVWLAEHEPHLKVPENRFPFKKENVHNFLQYSGACCRRPTKLQSLPHITQL